MTLLPDLKILSYSKNCYDRYNFIEFDNNYKKRKNRKFNYEVSLNCLVSEEELQNFFIWFEEELSNGTNSFNSGFEILRDTELVEYFLYKFSSAPKFQKIEGDLYSLDISLIRIVESCSFELLSMINYLQNIQKNLRGENTGIEAHVACPLIFQNIGVSLTNLKNMVKEHPNDYKLSNIFA